MTDYTPHKPMRFAVTSFLDERASVATDQINDHSSKSEPRVLDGVFNKTD